jgi:hypothetical protein
MRSSIFIKKNLEILLLSIESLDPYALDQLMLSTQPINYLELFTFKTSNIMHYRFLGSNKNFYASLIVVQKISNLLAEEHFQQNIVMILKELSSVNNMTYQYSYLTSNYIKRFQHNYRKSSRPYLIGNEKYKDVILVRKLSIMSLFLLYESYSRQGIYSLVSSLELK